jgi:hypothetical protein
VIDLYLNEEKNAMIIIRGAGIGNNNIVDLIDV